ncbi:alpha-glycosidase [Paenibacillus oenotherae]|uniref:Alpha-glycosidase n=1 Tax=Paenibacillus oenotherae TaxID=1435645 RepID=A0ABS7CZU2_9BACL|nr:alpha-glycosidase [Paenibacillus oenotherae]MBW7473132.1 alpha-glycosidase [Paenibacillus oenotherae]
MNLEAVYHRAKSSWSYAYDDRTLHIRIRTKKNDITAIDLHSGDKYGGEDTNAVAAMVRFASDALFDYWEAAVRPKYRRTVYYFALHDGETSAYVLEKGIFDEPPPYIYEGCFDFPFINAVDVLKPPAWVKDAVFYQIFPERFANGDPSLNPEGTEPWGGTPTPTNYFGGDLKGVMDHLDHLTSLGVNAIYFNPVFEATKNHKYDTSDYLKVDPQFGTNETLKELVQACHEKGIRVLLDAVFNHSGHAFPPFVDVLENGPDSQYADWFHVREWPLTVKDGVATYDTFGYEPIMPKLNTENPEVIAYLLKVAKYWIEEVGIDGWRLDVANEVDHAFWREFRKTVKAVNPEAYLLGEVMHDSLPWLLGDQFDAVMNYPFTNACIDFFARSAISAGQFTSRLSAQLVSYPKQANEVAFNLLGSHDTFRLLTQCNGNKERFKLTSLFQLTFSGVPCIYYGDEIGIDGGYDPGNRKCMEWDPKKQDRELLAFFQRLIALRHKYAALRTGSVTFLQDQESDTSLIYERRDEQDHFIILINNSDTAATLRTTVSRDSWTGVLSEAPVVTPQGQLKLQLPPFGYAILHAQVNGDN